ncbi:hypothetical protein IGI04_013700, partial [Brassica rapa subsp. trilocularis]
NGSRQESGDVTEEVVDRDRAQDVASRSNRKCPRGGIVCDKYKDLPGSTKETQEGLRAGEEKRGRCLDLKDYDDEDERLIFLDPPGWDIASAPF